MANHNVKKKNRYRPHDFNKDELRKLCVMQVTDNELAGWFGCSSRTIERLRLKPEYRAIMESGREEGKASLRRRMYAAAMNGSVTMMIFLGKNMLGMKDVYEQEHSMNPDKPFDFTLNISHPHAERAEQKRLEQQGQIQQPIIISETGDRDLSSEAIRVN